MEIVTQSCFFIRQNKRRKVYLSDKLHPQTLAVVQTRAIPLGLEVLIGDVFDIDFSNRDACAVLIQYPDTEGTVKDFSQVIENAHTNGVSDLMFNVMNVACTFMLQFQYLKRFLNFKAVS